MTRRPGTAWLARNGELLLARAIERMDEADREVLGLALPRSACLRRDRRGPRDRAECGQDAASAGDRAAPRPAGGGGCGTLDLAVTDETRMDAGLDDERLADQVADLAERIARGETPDLERSRNTRIPVHAEALQAAAAGDPAAVGTG